MAAKKNKPGRTVLNGFKDFGNDTLSRLATTVKVDVPAAAMAGVRKPRTALARLFGMTPEQKAARQLKQIKRGMDLKAMPRHRRRRSRLPLVIVMLIALIGSGGYWLYQKISLPQLNLSQYVDYQKWLDVVSGKTHPSRQRLAEFFGEQLPSEPRGPAAAAQPVRAKPAPQKSKPTATKMAKKPKSGSKAELARIERKPKKKDKATTSYRGHSKPMIYKPLGE